MGTEMERLMEKKGGRRIRHTKDWASGEEERKESKRRDEMNTRLTYGSGGRRPWFCSHEQGEMSTERRSGLGPFEALFV